MTDGYFKTALLMAGLTAFCGVVGLMIAGKGGMMIALGIAVVMNFMAYWNSDKAVLRMHDATQVDATTAPRLYSMVARLAANAGLPMPRVYVIENPQPNAFATGRNPENAAVAATTGLLQSLTEDEIAGVMAHELAHVKHHDTLLMTITASLAGAISMIGNFGLLFGGGGGDERRAHPALALLAAIVAPIAGMLIQMAVSRTREYEADRVGAEICGRPADLASALAKIAGGASQIDNPVAEAHPATAHMFIINPLHGGGMRTLFATHPDTQERINRLMAMPQARS